MEVLRKTLILESEQTHSSILAQTFWISIFGVLTALGAQIQIPHQPIPFTLQTFFVLLSGAFLGPRNGFIAQVLYIAAGAVGLPVFSGASFGMMRLFGLTGGYLMGFPFAAALIGYLVSVRQGYVWTVFAMSLGLVMIFSFGTLYLNFTAVHNLQQSLMSGFLIFTWWDILKLSAAAAIYNEFSKRYRKLPV